MKPESVLKKYFGYSHFREGQLEIISAILKQQPTLAILPTGGGKSICFQIPGLIFSGQTLVISPLISLMADQVEQLQKRNIAAVFLNSSLEKEKLNQILQQLDQYKFIYLAPERLTQAQFLKACSRLNISLIAIDEAHCISLWGHDFRPSYLKIHQFIESLTSSPTIAAFTATATPQVKLDIINSLHLKNPQVFTNSFARHNLTFITQITTNPTDRELALLTILKRHLHQPGIIYCSTHSSTQYVTKVVKHFFPQLQIGFYHGGCDTQTRNQIQTQFINHQLQLIAATNAFGMGVDKSDIRFVVHFQLPGCLENYYQEAGRAGRDRQPAICYLLADPQDLKVHLQFINQAPPARRAHLYFQLQQMIEYVQIKACKQNFILKYFGELPTHPCHHCDYCRYYQLALPKSSKIDSYLEILHPNSKKQLLKVPGIGSGWVALNPSDII